MADPPLESFESLQSALKPALLATTRTASALVAEDIPFQRSLDAGFSRSLDTQNARLLALADRLLASAVASGENVSSSTTTASASAKAARVDLHDGDALERNWGKVVDVIDSLLERTDGVLDEVRGVVKTGLGKAVGSETDKAIAPRLRKGYPQSANILKPQRTFEHAPNNHATGPWKPILTSKPHAKVPLEQSLRVEAGPEGTPKYEDTSLSSAATELAQHHLRTQFYLLHYIQVTSHLRAAIDKYIRYSHPYQVEIEEYRYPPSMYVQREPAIYQPWESTTATFVDTEEAMLEMLQELKKANEIAVDLEHHDQRTYLGIVCLMQISTRDRDWVVDTLKPWRRKLECLNEVFTNPSVIKVFHGSSSDVVWLQRDLGLYLVGLFDTEHAATALRYPKRSLAYLLEKFVNFQAQKQYQLADWRVRPLPREMFDYARSDTHFLLYVYDCMHNELVQHTNLNDPEGDLIDRVLRESKRYQLNRYEHPVYDAEYGLGVMGWYKQLFRTPALLSKVQFAVFKAIHQWRDSIARREDESVFYVMSNHTLTSIARAMPLTKEQLFSAGSITPFVRQHVEELIKVIAAGKASGADGPEMKDALAKSDEIADERMAQVQQAKHASMAAIMAQTRQENQITPAAADSINSPKRPTIVDIGSVKSNLSQFWGTTLGASTQQRQMSTDVRLALPMPEVTGEVFLSDSNVPSVQAVTPPIPTAPAPTSTPIESEVRSEVVDGVFTLRGMTKASKKRKAQAPTAEDVQKDLERGLIEIDDPGDGSKKHKSRKHDDAIQGEQKATKAERKARRELKNADVARHSKAELEAAARDQFIAAAMASASPSTTSSKEKKKKPKSKDVVDTKSGQLSVEQEQDTAVEAKEEEPFDYANAPNLLGSGHTEHSANARKKNTDKKKSKGKMDFDPYKKALDAPKGLPRAQKEKVGLGGTFK